MHRQKHTDETKKKISDANRGRKLSEETKKKIAAASSKRRHTNEAKEKMRQARLGKKTPHTEATKEKIRKSHLGMKFTEEHKRHMSDAHKGKDNHQKGRKQSEERKAKTRGEKNPNWRGGVTPLNQRIRHCFEYRQWFNDVFLRDDFTCCACGKRGGKLHAHHIKPFATIMKAYNIQTFEEAVTCAELWSINNGSTLCKECHRKVDNYWNKTKK